MASIRVYIKMAGSGGFVPSDLTTDRCTTADLRASYGEENGFVPRFLTFYELSKDEAGQISPALDPALESAILQRKPLSAIVELQPDTYLLASSQILPPRDGAAASDLDSVPGLLRAISSTLGNIWHSLRATNDQTPQQDGPKSNQDGPNSNTKKDRRRAAASESGRDGGPHEGDDRLLGDGGGMRRRR